MDTTSKEILDEIDKTIIQLGELRRKLFQNNLNEMTLELDVCIIDWKMQLRNLHTKLFEKVV